MRVKPILIVGITLFAASCATLAGKPVQSTPAPGVTEPQSTTGGGQGIGSSQQGPDLNGDISILPDGAGASRPDDRTTGVTVDAVRLVGGQLFWGAPR